MRIPSKTAAQTHSSQTDDRSRTTPLGSPRALPKTPFRIVLLPTPVQIPPSGKSAPHPPMQATKAAHAAKSPAYAAQSIRSAQSTAADPRSPNPDAPRTQESTTHRENTRTALL